MTLSNIRIVLVRTFHPGNIGSVARAMKTMGLSDLVLVAPKEFPSPDATKMAAGAEDVLAAARVTETLAAAIADCTLVAATTVRPRGYDLPVLTPQEAAQELIAQSNTAPVALVFGPERMGLHNKDIQLAKYRVSIPTNPEYGSLNLAAAVQILCYELFTATQITSAAELAASELRDKELPTSAEIEYLFHHLEDVLKQIHFLRPHQGETMDRLRNFIARAQPDVTETNILRGILRAIQSSQRKPDAD